MVAERLIPSPDLSVGERRLDLSLFIRVHQCSSVVSNFRFVLGFSTVDSRIDTRSRMLRVGSQVLAELPEITAADLPSAGWSDWLLTQVGGAVDDVMLRAMSMVVDAFVMPKPSEVNALRASAQEFVRGHLWRNPHDFFAFVRATVVPHAVDRKPLRRLQRGTATALRLITDYRPYASNDPPVSDGDALLVEHWRHEPQKPRATVVSLHGFSMGYPRFDAFAMFAAPIFHAGYDVALVTLPFHGARTPPSSRFSGERFAVPHVARLNEAVRQAIYEIHVLVDWLRQQSAAPVGLLGLSLGGYLTALMAGLRSDLAFAIPIVPPVCMGDLGWRFFSRSRLHRDASTPAFARDELRAAFRVHSPLTYDCQIDKRRLLILAGRGDRIVPPDHPHRLWRHWDEPQIRWFGGSHLAPFGRSTLQTAIIEHLNGCTE